jgi:nucleoid DNA-binding protein/nucleoid-associated protein YgaU
MNEKISLQDLVVLLTEKSGIIPKDAETLVKECFDIMEEGLINDKFLKIRNLGTFKLAWAEDCESVDASTGEKVLIPAHYEVTFSPDIELSQIVNAPYASMEITEIEENEYLEKINDELNDSDDEIEDKINENSAKSAYFWGRPETQKQPDRINVEDEPKEPQKAPGIIEARREEPKIIEVKQEEPEITESEPEEPQEEPEITEAELEEPQEKPEITESDPEEPQEKPEITEADPEEPQEKPETIEPEPEEPEVMKIEEEKPEDKKEEAFENKNNEFENEEENEPEYNELYDEDHNGNGANKVFFWLLVLIISGLILVFAGRYFYSNNSTSESDSIPVFSNSVTRPERIDSLETVQEDGSTTTPVVDVQKKNQTQNLSEAKTPTPPETNPATAQEPQKNESQPAKIGVGQYMIHPGERLNIIALRIYGHKAFWVYLYDENRAVINNPDVVDPGTVINIPPAEKYGIDKDNPESINKALYLQQQYKTH